MTDAPPCSSKHGAYRYRTGPEPAGGRFAGGGTSWPQIRVDLLTGAGACCAATGAAAHSTAQARRPNRAVTRVNMGELPTNDVQPLSVLVFRRRLKAGGRNKGLR